MKNDRKPVPARTSADFQWKEAAKLISAAEGKLMVARSWAGRAEQGFFTGTPDEVRRIGTRLVMNAGLEFYKLLDYFDVEEYMAEEDNDA